MQKEYICSNFKFFNKSVLPEEFEEDASIDLMKVLFPEETTLNRSNYFIPFDVTKDEHTIQFLIHSMEICVESIITEFGSNFSLSLIADNSIKASYSSFSFNTKILPRTYSQTSKGRFMPNLILFHGKEKCKIFLSATKDFSLEDFTIEERTIYLKVKGDLITTSKEIYRKINE